MKWLTAMRKKQKENRENDDVQEGSRAAGNEI